MPCGTVNEESLRVFNAFAAVVKTIFVIIEDAIDRTLEVRRGSAYKPGEPITHLS
jgi:hypothetical protein